MASFETEESAKIMNVAEEVEATFPNALEELRKLSLIASDSAEYDRYLPFYPEDVTTNPSLILKAIQSADEYRSLFETLCERARKEPGLTPEERTLWTMNHVLAEWAFEVHEEIPGRVSIELDPRLSFDTCGTVNRARELLSLTKKRGVPANRLLLKVAATWEGLQAIRELSSEGIKCNATLVFSLAQAAAAVEAGAAVVSPFVGRASDWCAKHRGTSPESAGETEKADFGVELAKDIFAYVHGNKIRDVQVMAASFRNVDQVFSLAGCDILTLSIELMADLVKMPVSGVKRVLNKSYVEPPLRRTKLSEAEFRWALNENAMATELLSDGIRRFTDATRSLEAEISERVTAC